MKYSLVRSLLFNILLVASVHAMAADISLYEDTLVIKGPIVAGDTSMVILFAENYEINTVLLSSYGGVAREGVAIAYTLHKLGVETVAVDDCVSACAMIWLSGKNRVILNDAQVLQHGIYTREGENLTGDHLAAWKMILTQLYNTIAPKLTDKLIDQLDKPIDHYIKLQETKL